jgi:16S rRNA (cytidine1402-2'-O)-methyltransferase
MEWKKRRKIMSKIIEKSDNGIGTLYIVGTPIGNLGDITFRAVETLKNVDVILAEDTRQTLKLLNHFNIEKHMISYHRHNEDEKIDKVVELLDNSKNVALVSDAGMPVISDPGQNLIKYLTENNYKIEVIPGVTAVITAIVKSGMDSTRFTFEGFLSVNKKQRKERLNSLKDETRTMIFYEAPHKILATLKDMYEVFGNRKICIARELTKMYEEFIHITIKEAIDKIEECSLRGEIVLLIQGKNEQELQEEQMKKLDDLSIVDMVKDEINSGETKKEAIKKVAKLKGLNKNDVYKECLDI